MAAPTFVGAGTGWAVLTGNANGTKASVTVGNLIIVHVNQVAGGISGPVMTMTTTNSSLEDLAGTDNALTFIDSQVYTGGTAGVMYIYAGRALSTTVTVNVATTGADMYCRIYEFAGASAGTTAGTVFENDAAPDNLSIGAFNTVAQIDDVQVATFGADRLALNFVGVEDDNAVGPFTGMTGGTWAEAVAEYTDASGAPDGCTQLQTATMASLGTIDGGSYTMAAADPWCVIGTAIIPQSTPASLIWSPPPMIRNI